MDLTTVVDQENVSFGGGEDQAAVERFVKQAIQQKPLDNGAVIVDLVSVTAVVPHDRESVISVRNQETLSERGAGGVLDSEAAAAQQQSSLTERDFYTVEERQPVMLTAADQLPEDEVGVEHGHNLQLTSQDTVAKIEAEIGYDEGLGLRNNNERE